MQKQEIQISLNEAFEQENLQVMAKLCKGLSSSVVVGKSNIKGCIAVTTFDDESSHCRKWLVTVFPNHTPVEVATGEIEFSDGFNEEFRDWSNAKSFILLLAKEGFTMEVANRFNVALPTALWDAHVAQMEAPRKGVRSVTTGANHV